MTTMLFFELIQVAMGNRRVLSRIPSVDEWTEIYETAKKQALMGLSFAGVERLSQAVGSEETQAESGHTPSEEGGGQLPPPRMIRQWAVKADRIRELNARLDEECVKVSRFFEDNGFDAVILKGQANCAYYPERLQGLRTAGDIDVWVAPSESSGGKADCPVRTVIEFCLSKAKGKYLFYHNMDFPMLKNTVVEVHYRPTWLFCPWRNARLQKWLRAFAPAASVREGSHACGVTTSPRNVFKGFRVEPLEFNVVFQLLHLYKHIFEEGIGLRQLIDYYFVLSAYAEKVETDLKDSSDAPAI